MLLMASPSSVAAGGFSISEVSGVIEALAAIVNLALVIGFFVWERRDYRIGEQKRLREETYSSWYRLLVEERLIVEIDEYFNKVVELLPADGFKTDAVANITVLQKIIDQIKAESSQKKRILIPTLDLFDKDFRKSVWGIFQDTHEKILQKIEEMSHQQTSEEDLLEFINESKAKLYSELYNFNLKKIKEIGEACSGNNRNRGEQNAIKN